MPYFICTICGTQHAGSFQPKELAEQAFDLYERFRPAIPDGVTGWGTKGNLDMGLIKGLAKGK
jgi:hypothetical protein